MKEVNGKMTEKCEVCKKEITKSFTFVDCSYFEYHSKDECGGCDYPVGNTCVKKIPKEFHNDKYTIEEWNKAVEESQNDK